MRTLNDITSKRERQEEIIIESDIINRYHVINSIYNGSRYIL